MPTFSKKIKISMVAACALFASMTVNAQSQAPAFKPEILDRSITHFYQSPNLLNVFTAVETAVANNQTTKAINFETLAIFFSEVFRRSPEAMNATVQHFSQYKNDLNALPWMAAWLANSDDGRAMVEKLRQSGYDNVYQTITAVPPVDVRNFQPRSQSVVDAMWVYFYAAGDLQDLTQIFQIAMFDQKNTTGEFMITDEAARKQLRDYASGSLVVHAALHPKVMTFLGKAEQGSPEEVKAKIVGIRTAASQLIAQMQSADNQGLGQILEQNASQ